MLIGNVPMNVAERALLLRNDVAEVVDVRMTGHASVRVQVGPAMHQIRRSLVAVLSP